VLVLLAPVAAVLALVRLVVVPAVLVLVLLVVAVRLVAVVLVAVRLVPVALPRLAAVVELAVVVRRLPRPVSVVVEGGLPSPAAEPARGPAVVAGAP